jgi:hypothetical protein
MAGSASPAAGMGTRSIHLSDRRFTLTYHWLLLEHSRGLACNLQHQLAGPRLGPPALRYWRPFSEQLVAADTDHG